MLGWKKKKIYPNKAVMEMHPQQFSRQCSVASHMFPSDALNNLLSLRTTILVEILPQFTAITNFGYQNYKSDHKEIKPALHLSLTVCFSFSFWVFVCVRLCLCVCVCVRSSIITNACILIYNLQQLVSSFWLHPTCKLVSWADFITCTRGVNALNW